MCVSAMYSWCRLGVGGGYIGLQLETAICRDWLTEDKIRPTPHAESNSWTKLMLKVCAINSLERLLLRDSLNADNDSWTVMTHLCSSNKLKAIFSRQTEREAPSQFTHAMDQRKYLKWKNRPSRSEILFLQYWIKVFTKGNEKLFFFHLQRQDMKLGTGLTARRLFKVHHRGVFHLNQPAGNPDLRLDFRAINMCSHVLKKTI